MASDACVGFPPTKGHSRMNRGRNASHANRGENLLMFFSLFLFWGLGSGGDGSFGQIVLLGWAGGGSFCMGSSVCCIQADIFCCCCLSSFFLTAAGFKAVELRGFGFSKCRHTSAPPFPEFEAPIHSKKNPQASHSPKFVCRRTQAATTDCLQIAFEFRKINSLCCSTFAANAVDFFPGMCSRYVYLMIIKSPLSSGRRELRKRKGKKGSPTNGFSYIPPFSFSPCNWSHLVRRVSYNARSVSRLKSKLFP